MNATRVVNLRAEPFDIRIDRLTLLGNEYRIGPDGNRASVIERHMAKWRALLACEETRAWALSRLREMKGKRLGCHCAPLACHGDNYVKLIAEFCP